LAEAINTMTGNRSELIYLKGKVAGDDPMQRRPDITRARNLLGWTPVVNLEEGLQKTIPYFREKMQSV
jgi:nucleoside-diphosphate-sugar epimerase